MKKLCIFTLSSVICVPISAQVYSYVDKNGHTIYTDNPPRGQVVRKLDLETSKPINKLNQQTETDNNSQRTIQLSPQESRTEINQPQPSYSLLRITLPEPEATVTNTGGIMTVSVESNPSIMTGHHYQVLVDGKKLIESPNKTVFQLENLERGEHQLSVAIVNSEGQIIEQTPAQPFYIKQTTLADKLRMWPCKLNEYGVRPECPLSKKPKPQNFIDSLIQF